MNVIIDGYRVLDIVFVKLIFIGVVLLGCRDMDL